MSKKRVLCTIAGQEMVDSSDTEDDDISDTEVLNANKKKPESNENREEAGSDDEKKNRGESSVSNDPQAATNLKKVHKIKISKKDASKVVLKSGERKKKEKDSSKNEEVGEEKGKTLMELLELEMRARAIKALLMKAGKDEGEAESLAIEEALDEQKKKQENGQALVEKASSMKAKPLRQRANSDEEMEEKDKESEGDNEEEAEGEEVERVFNSQTTAMSKAREALMVSENKKMIEDEVKSRKEDEAKFMYEEQLRKEREEKERIERDKLVKEVRAMKQKVIEEEQEQRRLKIEEEREKMRRDHERKEQLKQQKDKDKLFSKIAAMKDEEQKEKDALNEHYKTKFAKKNDDEEDMVLDDDEAQKMRSYRRKDGSGDQSDDSRSRSRSRSYSSSPPRRRPYSRSSDEDSGKKKGGKTRLKKKIAHGSDVEDGEVEEVDSDAEDEIEREEDQQNLLEKMKNLKKKFSEMEEKKTEEGQGSGPSSPQPQPSSRGRGRGRGGRGRGRGRGKPVNEEDEEWSMQKYDFEAPDIQEALEGHKPNFVKPAKRVFEKGYNSEEEKKEDEKQPVEAEKPKKGDSGFKKVSRDEWNKMSKAEKKKYLKERKKWKLSQTVYIKDDSDNEQLTDEDNDDDEEELKYSDSENEEEKQERLAREALKSYAGAFKKDDDPEDYQLVMRKDVVEKELADTDDSKYETAEDIEFREKREKLETKELERKAKMREERLRRMQAFQASSILREEPQEEEHEEDEEEKQPERMDEDQYEVEVTTESKPVDENPFYSSYEALEKKDELDDPLKEERERIKAEQEKDEAELRKIKESKTPVPVFEPIEEEDKLSASAPPTKKPKIEIGQMSLGALKSMIDSEREKVQKEMEDMEEKTRKKEQEEEDKKKKAEQVLRRAKRRGDANNPSKEEVDAAQELEQMTWQDRYMKNRKVKDVVEKSQLLSKVKKSLNRAWYIY